MMKKLISSVAILFGLSTVTVADVKIGNPMARTGPIPELVKPMSAAVDLAVEHVNDQGGLFSDGQKYIAVKVDSACDPVAAVDAVTKLVNVEMVTGIVGPVCSGSTIAQAESVSIPAGVVTLSVSASSPENSNPMNSPIYCPIL